jgi:hypothetical protein
VSVHTEAAALVFVNANRTTPQTRGHTFDQGVLVFARNDAALRLALAYREHDTANTSRPSAASVLCRGHQYDWVVVAARIV